MSRDCQWSPQKWGKSIPYLIYLLYFSESGAPSPLPSYLQQPQPSSTSWQNENTNNCNIHPPPPPKNNDTWSGKLHDSPPLWEKLSHSEKVLVPSFFTLFVQSNPALHICPKMGEEFFFTFHPTVGQRAVIWHAAVNIRTNSHPRSKWWHGRHHELHPHLAWARGANESL